MESENRGKKKKVRGRIGNIRLILGSFPILGYMLLNLFIGAAVALPMTYVAALKWGPVAAIGIFMVILFVAIIVYNWLGITWMIRTDRYYARQMSDKEYNLFSGKNLVHYTDYLSNKDVESFNSSGVLKLFANGNIAANYTMLPEDREKKFVWFHLSESDGSDEPNFDSYWFSHYGETTPRSYKVVIPFSSLPRDLLLYRSMDGAVSVIGDYEGPARLFTDFRWYGEKIYFWKSLHFPYRYSHVIFWAFYLQVLGKRKDKIKQNHQSSSV